jgi:monothiol glutaredoxin
MANSSLEKVAQIVQANKIVLFMKGTKSFPMCGFSARAVAILNELNVPFESVNVLDDEEIRQAVKEYGQWPTIPQLYVNQKLVGGSDIMLEMYEAGELQDVVR